MTSRANSTPHRPVSGNLHFRLMTWTFRARDIFRPPSRLLREAGVGRGRTVLDFGCGPGSFSLAAARLVGKEGRVWAVDIHPLAVRMVERRARRRGLTQLKAVFSDRETGLEAESVDVVLLYDVLHEIDDKPALLEEFHRLLRPGGLLSFHDHFLGGDEISELLGGGRMFRFLRRGRHTTTYKKI